MPELWECKIHGLCNHSVSRNSRGVPTLKCVRCVSIKVTAYRKNLREKLIRENGGQCVKCGYSKSVKALHFHHKDPTTKRFPLSTRGLKYKLSVIAEEVAKCEILCANCHYEHHYDDTPEAI